MSSINETPGTSTPRSGAGDGAADKISNAAHAATEQARHAAQSATEQAKQAAQSAGDSVKAAAVDLKNEAGKIASDAAGWAKSFAEENKGKVAGQIDSISTVLNKAADDLESSEQGAIAGYVRQLAGGVEQVSTTLRDRGVEDLFGMVGKFARSQPAAFIGGAALLGFIASRFAVSSARSAQSPGTNQNSWEQAGSNGNTSRSYGSASSYGQTGGTGTGYSQGGGTGRSYGQGTSPGFGGTSGAGASGGYGQNQTDQSRSAGEVAKTGTSPAGGAWTSSRDTEGGTI